MGKGSNTTTTNNVSAPDPQAAAAYRDILARAQGVASTPYQAYTGDLTAPINAQQNMGVAGINSNAGYANPYIQQAAGQAASSSAPITGETIQGYQNPYTQQVVDATTAQMRNDFGQQHASLTGNQISQGALGGNATGVARGILSGQQGRTMASTVAGLYDKSYQQALSAAQQQQQTGLAGANATANYGIAGQNAALTGATAQVGAGSMMQANEQARLNAMYGQYQQQQAFPYQQTQWLAGIGTGVGSNLGGVSSGQTTAPPPNQTAQWLGLGLSAAGMLSDRDAKEDIERVGEMNDGTPIYRFRYKGDSQWHIGPIAQDVEKRNPDAVSRGVDGMRYVDMHEASEGSVERAAGGGVGGMPWSEGIGWIPQVSGIHAGPGAPRGGSPSGGVAGGGFDPSKLSSGITGAGNGLKDFFARNPLEYGSAIPDSYGPTSVGGAPLVGPTGPMAFNSGVGLYADGGAVMTDEDPVGIAGGTQFAQGSPYQIRQMGSGQVQVINVRTGQVHYTGTQSGASNAQASLNYRNRARGGGVGGMPLQEWLQPQGMFGEGEEASPVQNWKAPQSMFGEGEPADTGAMPVFGPDGKMMGNQTSAQGQQAAPEAPVVAEDDEEAPAPTGVAGRSRAAPTVAGGAPMGGVSAFAPEGGRGSYSELPDAIRRPQDERAGFGLLPISKNAGTGLMAAGLGMLASRSPNLGNAVGEGGLTGVAAYGRAEENDRKVAAEAAKLSQEARKDDRRFGLDSQKFGFEKEKEGRKFGLDTQKFGLDTRKHAETVRNNKASEAAGSKLPPLYTYDKEGNIILKPGAEDATAKLTAARKGPEGEPLSDEAVGMLAGRVRAGDVKALVGLGRGAQSAADLRRIHERVAKDATEGKPVNPAAQDILQNAAQQAGLVAAERTQANIMAKLSVYGRTAFNATEIALELSKAVPRTNFQPINKVLNAARTKTGDPKIVALGQSLMTLTNEYARAIGGGHGTVHDKEAAEKRLSEAQSHAQLEAVINVMRQEILAEERAMPAARQHIRDIYNPGVGGAKGKSIAGEHGAKPPPGPVSGASGFPPEAIAREYNGKTYYYDPNTKQPYPGQ